MVVKKRLDRRANGFQVTFVPKGRRSARRSPFKKTAKDPQNCAFELLASLAGRLLQEGESSSASSNASEEKDWSTFSKRNCRLEGHEEEIPLKTENTYQVSFGDITSNPEVASQNNSEKFFQHSEGVAVSKDEPLINYSNCPEKVGADVKFVNRQTDNSSGDCYGRVADAWLIGESCDVNVEKKLMHREENGRYFGGKLTPVDKSTLKDTMKLCDKSALIDSQSDIQASYSLEAIASPSSCRHEDNIKLGCRDDDEKVSKYNKSSTKHKAHRRPQRIAHRRIRKLLASKYWKLAPKSKDYELSRSDMGVKPLYRKRKVCYGFEGFHHNSVFKKMKVSEQSSVVNSDGGFSSNSVSNSLVKGTNGDKNGVTGLSSPFHSHQSSFHSKNSHVKLSIKSFRVPEIYVEVPETATVGSLKRTVMEAVMAILGGGLRVGLLVQGKRIRDDHKTLRQTGIACKENLDTLGFTLEPSSVPAPHPVSSVDPTPLSSSETSQPLNRSPGTTVIESGITDCTTDSSLLTNTGNHVESNNDLPLSQTDATTDKIDPDSKALVIVPERNTEPLALVPVSQKTRRSELVQRRTRRPFSVSEVEALVQAVEELGTGRWRDVKLRAFENAEHRTYVDLKDKWKTLVHTAKISPQQRRGEPVPQELLNRVLAAHAYWSQHQARQNGKHQSGTPKIADSAPEGAGGSILQVV